MNDPDLDGDIAITCIIPAYNEEKNIPRVLDVATTFRGFGEILVIDDGSHDKTTQVAQSYQAACPTLRVITLPKTNGKAGVIKRGIIDSKDGIIVTLDADLIHLTHENISSLILPVMKREVDQTILDRAGDHTPVWGWTNCAKYFGGERAFWKKDFLEIDIPDSSGYLLEIINNLHYIRKGKTIRTIFCSNLYTVHQFNKLDMITGTKNYIAMSISIVRAATVRGFVRQFFWIEDHTMHGLFLFYKERPLLRPVSGLLILLLHIVDGVSLFILLNALKMIKLPLRLAGRLTMRAGP
ncbi:MAG: glycosyltransferase family 2 protein [Deltaproteobacteria bacterium]|nr:glycosyltransferase family 2 protein [Deltaproteobacteria bacterium]MCL5276475.1 glycosyltransferase family 2 protein [Deltaproteobacteria bacterium]